MPKQNLEHTPILPSNIYVARTVSELAGIQHGSPAPRHSTPKALNDVTSRRHLTAAALDQAAVIDGKTPRERIAIELQGRWAHRLQPGDLHAVSDGAPAHHGAQLTLAQLLGDTRRVTIAQLDAACEAAGVSDPRQIIARKLEALWEGRLV